MANHASHAALPYPIINARYTVLIPYLDADGDPTDPTTPDTELSKDDGAAADAAEEVGSPKNSVGMLTLTGAETNCSCLSLAAKAASGPKTTLGTLFPRVLAAVGSGTLSAGSAGGGTLGTLLAYDVTGCFIRTTGGTGGGGTGGANNQARKIVTYNTSTGAFTVSPNWETTPSTDTTYDVLLPEGVTLGMLRALNPATPGRTAVVDASGLIDATAVKLGPSGSATAQTARDIGASVLLSSGTGTGQLDFTSGVVKSNITQFGGSNGTFSSGRPEVNATHWGGTAVASANVLIDGGITAAKIAADAITDAKVASDVTIASVTGAVGSVTGNVGGNVTGSVGSVATGGISASSFAAGAIDAAAIAANAIGASELAADAVAEIQSGLSTLDAAGVRTAVGLASANLDTQLAAIAGYIDTEIATLVTNVATILAAVDTEVGAIKAVTDAITATGTGLSAIPWNPSWDAEVQSEVDDALKATLTEGYRATNSIGSVRDLLYEIIAHLGESSISSTTKTLKKIDGSTTAKTYTLDSATVPTSITETT